MHCYKNIFTSFFLSWIVFGMSVTARADTFEAPAEVESIVKKNYGKYQFWRGSECLLIDGGHEFCALAIDKSVESYTGTYPTTIIDLSNVGSIDHRAMSLFLAVPPGCHVHLFDYLLVLCNSIFFSYSKERSSLSHWLS